MSKKVAETGNLPLGVLVTIGSCATTSSLLICPGERGIMFYRFTP